MRNKFISTTANKMNTTRTPLTLTKHTAIAFRGPTSDVIEKHRTNRTEYLLAQPLQTRLLNVFNTLLNKKMRDLKKIYRGINVLQKRNQTVGLFLNQYSLSIFLNPAQILSIIYIYIALDMGVKKSVKDYPYSVFNFESKVITRMHLQYAVEPIGRIIGSTFGAYLRSKIAHPTRLTTKCCKNAKTDKL